MFKKVSAKLGNMRKPQEFIAMPMSGSQPLIMVQSDKSIGFFDYRTGEGKLNTQGCYFPHLSMAKPFRFSQEFVQACLEACPSLGGQTDLGGVMVNHTVQII